MLQLILCNACWHLMAGREQPAQCAMATSLQVIHRTHMPNKGDELHHTGGCVLTVL